MCIITDKNIVHEEEVKEGGVEIRKETQTQFITTAGVKYLLAAVVVVVARVVVLSTENETKIFNIS